MALDVWGVIGFHMTHTVVDDMLTLAVAVLVFIPAFLIAIAQTRRVGRKVDDAASAAADAAEATDIGNGKKLGIVVHDMAQMQEVLSAQVHTNTKELLNVQARVEDWVEESRSVHDQILKRLDTIEGEVR